MVQVPAHLLPPPGHLLTPLPYKSSTTAGSEALLVPMRSTISSIAGPATASVRTSRHSAVTVCSAPGAVHSSATSAMMPPPPSVFFTPTSRLGPSPSVTGLAGAGQPSPGRAAGSAALPPHDPSGPPPTARSHTSGYPGAGNAHAAPAAAGWPGGLPDHLQRHGSAFAQPGGGDAPDGGGEPGHGLRRLAAARARSMTSPHAPPPQLVLPGDVPSPGGSGGASHHVGRHIAMGEKLVQRVHAVAAADGDLPTLDEQQQAAAAAAAAVVGPGGAPLSSPDGLLRPRMRHASFSLCDAGDAAHDGAGAAWQLRSDVAISSPRPKRASTDMYLNAAPCSMNMTSSKPGAGARAPLRRDTSRLHALLGDHAPLASRRASFSVPSRQPTLAHSHSGGSSVGSAPAGGGAAPAGPGAPATTRLAGGAGDVPSPPMALQRRGSSAVPPDGGAPADGAAAEAQEGPSCPAAASAAAAAEEPQLRWHEIKAWPALDPGTGRTLVVVTQVDVTERRESEERMTQVRMCWLLAQALCT